MEKVYKCKHDNKPHIDLKLNSYECAMLNDLELYSVHVESTKIEKWSIFNTKIHYVEHNRKELPSNRVKLGSTGGKCQKRI